MKGREHRWHAAQPGLLYISRAGTVRSNRRKCTMEEEHGAGVAQGAGAGPDAETVRGQRVRRQGTGWTLIVRACGQVYVVLERVNPFLVCHICDGYFREAYTIQECLHSCSPPPPRIQLCMFVAGLTSRPPQSASPACGSASPPAASVAHVVGPASGLAPGARPCTFARFLPCPTWSDEGARSGSTARYKAWWTKWCRTSRSRMTRRRPASTRSVASSSRAKSRQCVPLAPSVSDRRDLSRPDAASKEFVDSVQETRPYHHDPLPRCPGRTVRGRCDPRSSPRTLTRRRPSHEGNPRLPELAKASLKTDKRLRVRLLARLSAALRATDAHRIAPCPRSISCAAF